ncbi:MAG: EcsC family protein [Pseudomonadota bacterium]|nr:EcsC family protein [Pseudomonadota bacterium]
MEKELSENKMMQVLDWAYDKAVNGVPGIDSATELAQDYMKQEGSAADQVNSLIRWQITKAATSGFVSGLGGILTLPVAIPANIASVMYVQVRMIAAIAHIGGHDLKEDRVKALVYVCLTGSAATDILKDIGINVGSKLTKAAIMKISGETIKRINQAVGFKLLTKAGSTGAVNLVKVVPVVAGLIGGTIDSLATNTIGNIARDTFIH